MVPGATGEPGKHSYSGYHIDSWLNPLIVFLFTFTVYFWCAPRTVVLEDDGLFILAAYFNGVAHPPGYPLYTIMAHIWSLLPFGNTAFKMHLLSAFFAASASVCIWIIGRRILHNNVVAYSVALCFGYSCSFWSQAIITEVYSLNVFLVLLLVINCLSLSENPGKKNTDKKTSCLFLLYGLALSNHWPLVILSTPMLIAFLWPVKQEITGKSLSFLVLGLLPYLWMVINSNMNPAISFYGPIENWADFWFYITRQGYESIDTSPSAGWLDRIYFLVHTFREIPLQFGIICSLFIAAGFVYQFFHFKKHIISALVLGYLGSTVLLILSLDFDYDHFHRAVFRVYPLISWACASIWLGAGIQCIVEFLTRKSTRINRTILVSSLVLLTSSTVFAVNLPDNYRRNDTWALNYARAILGSLPQGSVLFLAGEVNIGPVAYLNKIEGYREDIQLYHEKAQVFNNRLYKPFKVTFNEVKSSLNEFINKTDSPVFYTNKLIHSFGNEYYGLYSRVLMDEDEQFYRAVLLKELEYYWSLIIANPEPADTWELMHYQTVLSSGCRLLSIIDKYALQDKPNVQILQRDLCNNLQGVYIELELELQNEHTDRNKLEKLLKKGRAMLAQARGKQETALIDYYQGRVLQAEEKFNSAVDAYKRSITTWDHPGNPSHVQLEKLK